MLVRDPQGLIVPAGRVRKELVECFDRPALPWWLSLPSTSTDAGSSVTYGDPASTEGYAQLNTSAVNASRATLTTTTIDLSKLAAVRLTAEGVYFSADTVDVSLGLWDSVPQYGARILHRASDGGSATGNSFPASGGQDELIDYTWAGSGTGEYTRRRNLSVYIDCRDKAVVFMEDDQTFYYSLRTTMGLGPVVGRLRVQTNTAATKWCRVEQFRLERWVN
jgi:hypothetical protein